MYWCCCIDSQALDSTFAKDDTLLPITLRLATASRKGVRSERGQRSSLKRGLFLYVKKRKSLLNLSALLYFFDVRNQVRYNYIRKRRRDNG